MPSGTFLSSGSCITGASYLYNGYLLAYQTALAAAVSQCTGSYVIIIGSDTYTGTYIGTESATENTFYNAMVLAIGQSKNKYYDSSGRCCSCFHNSTRV